MKKQLLAKLLVLGLVAAMLPIAAIAADEGTKDEVKCEVECGGTNTDDTTPDERPDRPEMGGSSSTGTETSTPSAVTVQTTTNASGQVVATTTVTATVSGSTATVTLSADMVASLISQAANSDVIVLDVAASSATEVVLNVPAASLVELATQTGADLTVTSAVANITLSNADLLAIAGNATNVQISAKVVDGKIQILVAADGQAVTNIPGGLVVAVPAADGASVFQVADDGAETEIEDAIVADGTATVTLYSSATIRIG